MSQAESEDGVLHPIISHLLGLGKVLLLEERPSEKLLMGLEKVRLTYIAATLGSWRSEIEESYGGIGILVSPGAWNDVEKVQGWSISKFTTTVVEEALDMQSTDGEDQDYLWNKRSIRTSMFSGLGFYFMSFSHCTRLPELCRIVLENNGILMEYGELGECRTQYVMVLGYPRTRPEVERLLILKEQKGLHWLSDKILENLDPLHLLKLSTKPMENLVFYDTHIHSNAGTRTIVKSLGGMLHESRSEQPCLATIMLVDTEHGTGMQTNLPFEISSYIMVRSEWVLDVYSRNQFIPIGEWTLRKDLTRLPSSVGSFAMEKVFVGEMKDANFRRKVIQRVRRLEGTVVSLEENCSLLILENWSRRGHEKVALTRYCVEELSDTGRPHVCSFFHFPHRILSNEEGRFKNKSFCLILHSDAANSYIESIVVELGGTIGLKPLETFCRPESAADTMIITDGFTQRERITSLFSQGAMVYMYTLVLDSESPLQNHLFDPTRVYPSEDCKYYPFNGNHVSTVENYQFSAASRPDGFLNLEFISPPFDIANGTMVAILEHFIATVLSWDNFIQVDKLSHPFLADSTTPLGFGQVSIQSSSYARDTVHGFFVMRDERAEEWTMSVAQKVGQLYRSFGIGTAVTRPGPASRTSIYVVGKSEDQTVRLFRISLHDNARGNQFADFAFSRAGIELLEDCVLPSRVPNPAVLIICGESCTCHAREDYKKLFDPYLKTWFLHGVPGMQMTIIETGCPLVVTCNVDNFTCWSRVNGTLTTEIRLLSLGAIQKLLEDSDRILGDDLPQITVYCPECVPDPTNVNRLYTFDEKCQCENSLVCFVMLEKRKEPNVLKTGVLSVDATFVAGGLKFSEIYELYGKASSGKTQFCMLASSTTAAMFSGGPNVIYIDTKNGFNTTHAFDLCFNDIQLMNKIAIVRLFTLAALLETLDKMIQDTMNAPVTMNKVRLLLIDSIPSVFYPAAKNYTSWEKIGSNILGKLNQLTTKYKLAVILTNNAVTPRNSPPKAALGRYWDTHINHRFYFSRNEDSLSFQIEKTSLQCVYKAVDFNF